MRQEKTGSIFPRFSADGEYLDSSEVYTALSQYLTESLSDDDGFSKIIYKYMLQSDIISGTQLCMLLYDQGFWNRTTPLTMHWLPDLCGPMIL